MWVGAVDLVPGDPPGRDSGGQRVRNHLRGQVRLGREPGLVRDAGLVAAVRIAGPGLGQVEAPIDERVPAPGGVGEEYRDLAVLDPPGGAGVLPLNPDRGGARLQVAGLVHDQHRPRVGEPGDHVDTHVVPDRISVPDRPACRRA